jgi:hypothetical protein
MRLRFDEVIFLLALVISGCTTQSVALIDPHSGATANCDASGIGFMSLAVDTVVDDCVKRIEKEGYVRIENLTPEQRAGLERTGKLPKESETPAMRMN